MQDAVDIGARAGTSHHARPKIASNGVIAAFIFVAAESMFFAALVAALTIGKAGAGGTWPPPGQPRLPVESTLLGTAVLLTSGVALFLADRRFRREARSAARPLLATAALGGFFVAFQGAEWMALVQDGLSVTASTHSAFFSLIVGTHGLHAVTALALLGVCYFRLTRAELAPTFFATTRILWYFVVGVWPILFWRVYLT